MMRILVLIAAIISVVLTATADRRGLFSSVVAPPTTQGFIFGVATNNWNSNNVLVGSYTAVNTYAGQGAYYSGTSRGAHIWTASAAQDVKLKLFRPIGTNVFNFIADILATNLSVGTSYVAFSQAVQEGDAVGLWLSNATGKIVMSFGNGAKFSAGDISSSGYSFGSSTANKMNIAIYGDAPVVAFVGDSILTPYPLGNSVGSGSDAESGGPTNSITWKMGNEMGFTRPYVNLCYPNKTLEWVNTNTMALATNTPATTLFVHCGVNDIGTGYSWASYLTNLNSIRAKWSGTLIMSEILPWTAGSDANALLVRTFNTNLSVWCATSSATLFQIHDSMGTNRPSTGQLDDLAVRYDLDAIHLTTAGRTNYARRATAAIP